MALKTIPMPMMGATALAAFAAVSFAEQDGYTLTVPDGLAFSEFKGYDAREM